MLAVQYRNYGSPDVLEVVSRAEPHAQEGAVRIRVLAVSINPIDYLLRAGQLEQIMPVEFPAIPGRDAVGVVDEIGAGVDDVATGDKVFGLGGVADTTAEYAVLTAWAKVPATWNDEQAAAAGLASVTALQALDALGSMAGATIVVDGAAGAVGGAAAAFALAAGAEQVIGTARNANHERLRAQGVTPVAYGDGLVERIRAVAPDGIDFALDAAGAGSLAQLVELVGHPQRVVTVADHGGAREVGVVAVNAVNDSGLLGRAATIADAGRYTPHVSASMSFRGAARAHALSEAGGGKIVLRVGLDV
ncbi:NADPH:quinone reductase [Rhodococcus sp. 06-156-3C]|uniref:NADP-dependent oxidoreductase n=1 Tax=Nocardiaceae TaxID=85025 RepID=UPI000522EC01|nr:MULTISPECIES: NADP-dependent oxidoreductase [Rhodococcus]OZD12564.1 NADPH:quinone reductase [Rhodococcus sp. 06-156-4a]OZD18027.1 NADPH:quinone reductase [Rhodococcus sp. 06-156-3C]OZD20413.1 NADPH:quinone reductase [Rhodococcus sp. 06-156-4C]OZD29257.1 NADPH:quinone reductase [Rhodococcus sp. 06-156-3]OZD30529.1 NADPH:quinone reductase [Rhodococcus sp. 06-156-3b]